LNKISGNFTGNSGVDKKINIRLNCHRLL